MARENIALDMTADPSEFTEAVEEFANRTPITRAEADRLEGYARKRSWWISGVAQMDIVNDAHESLLAAIREGTTFADWKKLIGPRLEKVWGRRDSARLETIFVNATLQGYNAGRWQQAREPHVRAVRPYAEFDGVADSHQSEICKDCDGTILPIDDPWWESHSPQLHHRCRSGIRTLRAATAEKKGITAAPPQPKVEQGWGLIPEQATPPTLTQRKKQPDPDLIVEASRKAGKDNAERKRVKIPKRLIKGE
jgi:SPP1 gp7 family putative phage head morphogenesis protein